MPDDPQLRQLYLVVPDGRGLLLLAGDDLPCLTAELVGSETTAMAAHRVAVAALGLGSPIRELCFDHEQIHDDAATGAVAALLVLEPPAAGWSLPPGHRWCPLDDAPLTDSIEPTPGLRARWLDVVSELRAEADGTGSLPALRSPWSRPGWYERASTWIVARLTEAGRHATGPPEQIRHWGISAVMRTPTDEGPVWFKGIFPLFHQEAGVTALLAREQPRAVAPVIAADADEDWLLLADVGEEQVEDRPDADEATVRSLVALQRAFIGRAGDLVALGGPERPFGALAAALADVFVDPVAREWIAVTPERAGAIVGWVESAAAAVDELGFPATLVHGDFHPKNVAWSDGGPIIFDWSDAAVAHPLVDAMTWSSWLREDPARGERAWQVFLDAWSDICAVEAVEPVRPLLTGLAAGYHAVSYAAILRRLEPHRRVELADGLVDYFARLDAAVPQ